MQVTAQVFWLPKSGNTEREYEDAFWLPVPVKEDKPWDFQDGPFRVAIADGATETSFSAEWATLLTRGWGEQGTSGGRFRRALPVLAGQWRAGVSQFLLPWYAAEKASAGAFSSLLGLTVRPPAPGRGWPLRWEAYAVGDSCLFHLRGGQLRTAFPLTHSDEFNSRPYLLRSISPDLNEISPHIRAIGGDCQAGDVFYLLTDALACAALRFYEECEADLLEDIHAPKDFFDLISQWRRERVDSGERFLRNDDVTLLRLEIQG